MQYYTLTQCMQLLAVNNRQLKRLLVTASIIPATTSSDKRLLVITDIQLTALRETHMAMEKLLLIPGTTGTDLHTLWQEIQQLKHRISSLEQRTTIPTYRPRGAPTMGQVDLEGEASHSTQAIEREGTSSLPDGYMNLNEFAALHHIPATTLRKAIDSGRLACHHNPSGWKHYRTFVKWAFDPEQQALALALYR